MDLPVYVPGYAVERQLGAGGDGSTWVAREEATGRQVALKVLHVPDPAARERARREAALMTAVDHPHVLPVLGVADTPGALVLVLELADGGSLAELLAVRGTMPPGEVVTACAPIAQALAELHARGLVHGDVSPANVLFSADGRPMLCDLGVARLAGEDRSEFATTRGFAAPEVEAGHPPQPGSDVFGLAVSVVRALTGYFPSQALILPGLPPATQAALAQAMHPDPSRRPDAVSLANALFALGDPEPIMLVSDTGTIAAVQPTTVDQPPHRSRRAARAAAATAAEDDDSQEEAPPVGRRATRARAGEPDLEPPRRRRRVDVARIAFVIAVPVILAGAIFAALQWFGNGDDPATLPSAGRLTSPGEAEVPVDLCGGPAPAPTEQPPEVTDWTQVVQSLYALRTEAFAELDASALCDVYAPTSQVLARDAQLLQLYADAGVHTEGLAFEVVTADLVSQNGRVVLQITDRLPDYQLVDDDGVVVAEKEGLPEDTWQAELVPAPDASGWRFG